MLQQSTLNSLTKEFAPHQLAIDPVELITYEVDAGFDRAQPDGVFYPASTDDVSRIMRWANRQRDRPIGPISSRTHHQVFGRSRHPCLCTQGMKNCTAGE